MKNCNWGGKQGGLGGFVPLVCMLKEALEPSDASESNRQNLSGRSLGLSFFYGYKPPFRGTSRNASHSVKIS